MVEMWFAVAIAVAAFLPPVIFLLYVRNQEKTRREPLGAIFSVFLFGAVVSILIALLLESYFTGVHREYEILRGRLTIPAVVFLVVVVAPLAEEFAKGLGVRTAKRHIFEEEDGIVYGAAAGFGFSATENLFYEIAALQESGTAGYVATAVIRTFTGCFLHATAAGLTGYGMGRRYLTGGTLFEVLPYFALAVLLHALFNFIAVLDLRIAVALIVVLSFMALRYTVSRIRKLDTAPPVFRPLGGAP